MSDQNILSEDHRQVCESLADALPDDVTKYDQGNGVLEFISGKMKCPACVGAWLAYVLKASIIVEHKDLIYSPFLVGKSKTADALGLDDTTLKQLLWAAGAPSGPFGPTAWTLPAPTVFRHLATITEYQARHIVAGELHTVIF